MNDTTIESDRALSFDITLSVEREKIADSNLQEMIVSESIKVLVSFGKIYVQ